MDAGVAARRLSELGVSSVQFLLASGLALILFVMFANVVAVQYGRGAIRSGLEQGARAGAIAASPAQCETVAEDVIGQLLGGKMADTLTLRCESSGSVMVARGAVVFESWSPLTLDAVRMTEAASSRKGRTFRAARLLPSALKARIGGGRNGSGSDLDIG